VPLPQVPGLFDGRSLDLQVEPRGWDAPPRPPPAPGGRSPQVAPGDPGTAGPRAAADSRTAAPRPRDREFVSRRLLRWWLWIPVALLAVGALPAWRWLDHHRHVAATVEILRELQGRLAPGGHFVGTSSPDLEAGHPLDWMIREALDVRSQRLPTRDAWGNRLRVRWSPARKAFIALSPGPDGEPGVCAIDDATGDDLCVVLGP
jgi:hypothetical protein